MGTPLFAVPILKSLYQNGYPISVVYTQPPQKSHRGQKINKSPVQGISETLNIDFRSPEKLNNNDEEYNFLKELNADLAIVVAYGQLIPKKFLDLTKKGFINIHGSLLPKWRGAAPIQRAIQHKDKETGISIMKIVNELDAGPFLKQVKISIKHDTNFTDLSNSLSNLGAKVLLESLSQIESKNFKYIEQDHENATYAKKMQKREFKINWNIKADDLVAQINSLSRFPGAWFELEKKRYKILKAVEIKDKSGKPGEVLDENLVIACCNNSIQIIELQREGKKAMSANEFLIGNKVKKGTKLN